MNGTNNNKDVCTMKAEEIEKEANLELTKDKEDLVRDIIKEANTLRGKTASELQNLDIIKHLIKRLAVHQVSLDHRAKKTNYWIIVLTAFTAIAAILSVFSYFGIKP